MRPFTEEDLIMSLDYENAKFESSDSEGMIKLYFRFSSAKEKISILYLKYLSQVYMHYFLCRKLKVNMEGISIISREIKIIHYIAQNKCKQIKILELAPKNKSYTMDNIVKSFSYIDYNVHL